jgi:phage terminase large subunit GpA-like protein
MGIMLRNAEHLIHEAMARAIAPPPVLDLNQWACENVVFGSESGRPGPYDPHRFPWNAGILEALGPTDPTRIVVLKGSAQFGKSVLAQVFCVGSVAVAGGYFLYTHPQEDNAKRWAKTKLRPMLRQSSVLTGIFGRVEDNSLSFVERRDGLGAITVSGARSESSLSMISVERQVQDDLAKWEDNNAGDPEEQADSRSASYRFRKIFKTSTAMIWPGCRITRAYKAGTQEQWHVPCPHCDHAHPLTWQNLLDNLDEEHPEKAAFSCPDCGGLIEQHHLRTIVGKGRWVAENPKAPHRSFFMWRAYVGVDTLADIATKWIQVKGDPKAEQTFYNDWLGLAYEVAGSAPPADGLRERAEAGHRRGVIPAGFPMLTIGGDVQGGEVDPRIELQVVAWGPELRRAPVDYIVVRGDIADEATRKELTRILERTWPTEGGGRIGVDMMAIDANAYTDDVLDWVKTQPASKVIAVRGANSELAPPLAQVTYERNKRGKRKPFARRFFHIGVSGLKAALYRNLAKDDPLERGYIAFPTGMEPDYFDQLTSEKRVRLDKRGKNGQERFAWVLSPGVRNEALDTMLYAEAAAIRFGWRDRQRDEEYWDRLCQDREVPPPVGQLDLEDLVAHPAHGVRDAGQPGQAAPAGSDKAPEKASGAAAMGRSLASRLNKDQ